MSHREFWNPERETLSADEIHEIQSEKIVSTVNNAYHNSPLMQRIWDETGCEPDQIDDIDDLSEAPVWRKNRLREWMHETGDSFGGLLCEPLSEMAENGARIGVSSGTTGISTNVVLSASDNGVLTEIVARYLWQMGVRPGEKLLTVLPVHHPTCRVGWPAASDAIGAFEIATGHYPADASRIVDTVDQLEPSTVVFVSSPMIDQMRQYMNDNNMDPGEVWSSVKTLGFGGEPLVDEIRSDLEEGWGVEMRELAGGIEPPFGYAECERQDRWLHLPDDLLHADVIDPETGESFEPGQRGELVISSLSYDAMPFVRFGYEDIVEFERGECPGCGRCGTRVRILGRVGDMLTIDGTEILPYDVSKVVQSVEEMPADLFQFYADSDEELRLKLGYDPELTDDVGPLEDTVAGRVENYTGVSVIVVDSVTEDELRDQGPTHKIPRIIEA